MKILVACEFSGIVRDAFSRKGHDTWSCDIIPTESELTKQEGKHIQDDVLKHLDDGWDMMIAHPPCTYLTTSANKYFAGNPERWLRRYEAALFFWQLWNAPINKIAIENPIGIISSYIKKPDQIINPYYFGDPIPKRTGLWLRNLPPLTYALSDNLFSNRTSIDPEYIEYNSKKK